MVMSCSPSMMEPKFCGGTPSPTIEFCRVTVLLVPVMPKLSQRPHCMETWSKIMFWPSVMLTVFLALPELSVMP